jgi:hypothetical protein
LIAANCHRLAIALVRQDKKTEALLYAKRAVDIYTQLGSSDLASSREILPECES